jgi:hypothetical protein
MIIGLLEAPAFIGNIEMLRPERDVFRRCLLQRAETSRACVTWVLLPIVGHGRIILGRVIPTPTPIVTGYIFM